jgi:hypothetical protein
LNEGATQGQFRREVEPIVFYRFCRDAIFLSVRWYRPGGRRTIDDLADSFITVVMEGYAIGEPVGTTPGDGAGRRRA